MEDVSVKLYKYMCDEVIGSEKVVNYRRQFFNMYDDVFNHRGKSSHMYLYNFTETSSITVKDK
jgi:hypothetical protein